MSQEAFGTFGGNMHVARLESTYSHESHIQAEVNPCELGSCEVRTAAFAQVCFKPIERGKELGMRRLVRPLGPREATAVDTVIDCWIDK